MIYKTVHRKLSIEQQEPHQQIKVESQCVVCSSSIYGFWLPLWYLQTLLQRLCVTNDILHYRGLVLSLFLIRFSQISIFISEININYKSDWFIRNVDVSNECRYASSINVSLFPSNDKNTNKQDHCFFIEENYNSGINESTSVSIHVVWVLYCFVSTFCLYCCFCIFIVHSFQHSPDMGTVLLSLSIFSYDGLFVLLSFSLWSLYCLSFLDLRLLTISLITLNFP